MITHAKAVNRCLRRAPSPWFCLFSLLSAPGGPLLRAPADALVRPTDTSGLSPNEQRPKCGVSKGHRRAAPSEAAGGLVVAAQVLERPGTRGRGRRAGGGKVAQRRLCLTGAALNFS